MKLIFIITISMVMIGLLAPSAFADHFEVVIGIVDESGFSKSCVDAGCYTPITATVHVGDTVTMTNTDPTGVHTFTSGTVNPHTYAPSPDGTFDSGILMAGDSFEWIPENAGIYPYYDMLHTWMIGTIIVQEEDKERNYDTPDEFIEKTIPEEKTPSKVVEKSKFKKYSNSKYNFSLEYPSEFDSHFKGVDSIPMIWKNEPHPELPGFKVWKTVKTIPEGIFATTYEFKVFSDNGMSEYSQSELVDLLENSSINLFTDMCSPENCTVTKTDSNISTNNNGAKILDIIVQTVTDYEKGVTQYITSSMRITILDANNDVLMIQHITSSSDNFTHLFYEPHFTHMIKSLETQYIPKGSLKNTSTIFTAYGETIVTPEEGGGCLIATATYGSELAPQVQQLRELRDNQLLNTESGTQFMGTFNDIYYSFSPIIADYERENPIFKEAVKIAITPMISSLSLMENANSESEVLGLGLSVIMLNLGMYLGIPAVVIVGIRKRI
jgi:plastocyanin